MGILNFIFNNKNIDSEIIAKYFSEENNKKLELTRIVMRCRYLRLEKEYGNEKLQMMEILTEDEIKEDFKNDKEINELINKINSFDNTYLESSPEYMLVTYLWTFIKLEDDFDEPKQIIKAINKYKNGPNDLSEKELSSMLEYIVPRLKYHYNFDKLSVYEYPTSKMTSTETNLFAPISSNNNPSVYNITVFFELLYLEAHAKIKPPFNYK